MTKRASKRFKWMMVTFVSLFGVYYVMEQGIQQVQNSMFVEAGEDLTYEQDEIYSNYIESAKLQEELMIKEKRKGHTTWTLKAYKQFQARRLQILISQEDLYRDRQNAVKDWHKKVLSDLDGNFDGLKEEAKNQNGKYLFKDKEYDHYVKQKASQGYVEEYYGVERCYSSMINTPGITLLPSSLMGFAYFVFLGYLFLGISISADIFMDAINVITSQTTVVSIWDAKAEQNYNIEVPVWNATMATLTLMAFGSSAPEILLNVLAAFKDLGEPADDLGPSTIVGSAAFNLLVISGVSVVAVGGPDGETKKVEKMGVFLTQSVYSVFAYIWLFMCLQINTPGITTTSEASWTFGFFFILLCNAFAMDKWAQIQDKKKNAAEEEKQNQNRQKKANLRQYTRKKDVGEMGVLNAAQGQKIAALTDNEVRQIRELYMEILETNDLSRVPLDTLMQILKPEQLFEKFAARKANQIGATKEFLEIKGQKFQMENDASPVYNVNDVIGFKCTHYSCTESSGSIDLVITKKNTNTDYVFGIRTVDDDENGTAKAGHEYASYDNAKVMMRRKDTVHTVSIQIFDNNDFQPDLEFFVELYDPNTGERLYGDDTRTKITILDEDFPGKLQFMATEVVASKENDRVDVVIERVDGSDGVISCYVKTEAFLSGQTSNLNAIEFEHYLPKNERIEFASGETSKIVQIYLVNEQVPQIDAAPDKTNDQFDEDLSEEEEQQFPKFLVLLEKAEPEAVKISKKNCCTVEIKDNIKSVDAANEHTKNIEFFCKSKNPTWGSQFIQATMLSPTLDEDNLIVDEPTLFDALMHFAQIGWKILFAIIPPADWGGGKPAFIVALIFIGLITAIVSEVATVLGCTLGIKSAVTAITLVAVGTSLPDTFASMSAAQMYNSADEAIGNVTGSNAVNVFVGLGLPWVISAFYQESRDPPQQYVTPPGSLAFSVILFLITSITCFMILFLRRCTLGGELGGPPVTKYLTGVIFVCLWLIYIIFSILKAYDIIEGIKFEMN